MTIGSFPTDPNQRKVIVALSPFEFQKCQLEPDAGRILVDQEAFVLALSTSLHASAPNTLKKILDAGLLRPGRILIQNPYDKDLYEAAESAAQQFALAKYMYFSLLCKELGAREVHVERIDLRAMMVRTSGELGGDYGGSGKVIIKNEELDRFRSQISLRDEFSGGSPDLVAAERTLTERGLWADPNMKSLLDLRRGSHSLITRTLVVNLSSEVRRQFDVLARLSIPTFLELSAEYKKIAAELRDYTLTVHVRF
jgi:hypothetical protein